MIRRRPTRSATAPKTSIRPPKVTAYAPVTHCSAIVEACRSRPMVGSATFRIELSSISKRNTADSPASATQASRSDAGERVAGSVGPAAAVADAGPDRVPVSWGVLTRSHLPLTAGGGDRADGRRLSRPTT
jgi:hypothetical protein